MNKDKIILTDADGVLVNWNDGFDKFMSSKGFTRIPNTDKDYAISARYGVSNHQGMEFVKEFNESRKIADLEAFADSVEYVIKLANRGFRFIVVTSLSDHPDAHEYRTTNLHNLFGDVFDEINCITMGANKAEILTRWIDSEYFWIEDHMRQAEAGHEAGLKPILISHPYNDHYQNDLFPKVSFKSPWEDIYKMVCDEYKIAM